MSRRFEVVRKERTFPQAQDKELLDGMFSDRKSRYYAQMFKPPVDKLAPNRYRLSLPMMEKKWTNLLYPATR